MVKSQTSMITEVPVTAESREAWLRELFVDDLPHPGELFVPTDAFYPNVSPRLRAQAMLKQLCAWLGIKPGYISLVFESTAEHHPDGSRYAIFVDMHEMHNAFVMGGFLAYSLTVYLLEEKKGIHLSPDQQTVLLASATISFGLGAVVMNGINPTYGWLQSLRKRKSVLLKDFPIPNYAQMFRNFLRSHNIVSRHYISALTPWAAKRLGMHLPKKSNHTVMLARQHTKLNNLKTIGIVWLIVLITGLGVFVRLQQARPTNPQIQAAQTEASRLHELKRLCDDALAYDRQYADLSDIQTQRALGADAARCKSLDNQYQAAEQRYNALLH